MTKPRSWSEQNRAVLAYGWSLAQQATAVSEGRHNTGMLGLWPSDCEELARAYRLAVSKLAELGFVDPDELEEPWTNQTRPLKSGG